jgi:hypothetical protein
VNATHRRNVAAALDALTAAQTKVELVREEYETAKARAVELWAAGLHAEARFVAAQAREMRELV